MLLERVTVRQWVKTTPNSREYGTGKQIEEVRNLCNLTLPVGEYEVYLVKLLAADAAGDLE